MIRRAPFLLIPFLLAGLAACNDRASADPPASSSDNPASAPESASKSWLRRRAEALLADAISSAQSAGTWAQKQGEAAVDQARRLVELAVAAAPSPPRGIRTYEPRKLIADDPAGVPDDALDWLEPDRPQRALPPRLVVLIHGLNDIGGLWADLAPELRRNSIPCARFDYPNDQGIAKAADDLAAALKDLRARGVERIDLVAHSMGGLVCRDLLTRPAHYAGDGTPPAASGLPAVERLITIGTPHKGAPLARVWWVSEAREHIVRFIDAGGSDPLMLLGLLKDGDGQAAADLAPGSPFLTELNARALPRHVACTCIVGVAADPVDRSISQALQWPWIDSILREQDLKAVRDSVSDLSRGLGDGMVSLESQTCPGVSDVVRLDANHETIIRNAGVERQVRRWLKAAPPGPPQSIPVIVDRLKRPVPK